MEARVPEARVPEAPHVASVVAVSFAISLVLTVLALLLLGPLFFRHVWRPFRLRTLRGILAGNDPRGPWGLDANHRRALHMRDEDSM